MSSDLVSTAMVGYVFTIGISFVLGSLASAAFFMSPKSTEGTIFQALAAYLITAFAILRYVTIYSFPNTYDGCKLVLTLSDFMYFLAYISILEFYNQKMKVLSDGAVSKALVVVILFHFLIANVAIDGYEILDGQQAPLMVNTTKTNGTQVAFMCAHRFAYGRIGTGAFVVVYTLFMYMHIVLTKQYTLLMECENPTFIYQISAVMIVMSSAFGIAVVFNEPSTLAVNDAVMYIIEDFVITVILVFAFRLDTTWTNNCMFTLDSMMLMDTQASDTTSVRSSASAAPDEEHDPANDRNQSST